MIKVYYGYTNENLSIKAHEVLDNILKDLNINANIIKSENGKPYIKNHPIYFNISHSNKMFAVAISDHNIGIDIEYIPRLKYGLDHKIYERWLSANELQDFEKEDDKLLYLTKRWTLKESYLKLNDLKFTIDNLKDIDLDYSNFKILNNYVISVLSDNKDEKEEYICIAQNVETK